MKSIVRILAVASAVVSLGASAEDADALLADLDDKPAAEAGASESDSSEETADGADANFGEAGQAIKVSQKTFYVLPFCRLLEGKAEVRIPGRDQWQKIEEGKYYPLGTLYRTVGADSRLTIKFGPEADVVIVGEASFSTRAQALSEKSRSIGLVSGQITVKVPTTLKEGLFSVTAPGFTAKNLAGESRYTYAKTGDGDEATIRCVTQTLMLEGPHFKTAPLRSANELRVRTSQDQLVTAIYGLSGDVNVVLDQGVVAKVDEMTGRPTDESEVKTLDWKLSPRTSIRIHRAKPTIGKRMIVTTMTFNERGELRNRRAFTERMVEVNSGELGPTSKADREALAKRAAEIAKSQEASDEAVDVPHEESGSEAEDAKADDENSSSELDF